MKSVLEILSLNIVGSDLLLLHFSFARAVMRDFSTEDVGIMSCETMLHPYQTALLHIPDDRNKLFR
jgi:hypothetical protein